MSRSAFIGPCAGGGSRTDIHVDVSCQPIIYIDICSAHIDISFNPVIHVDVSYQPVIVIDISCQPIVYVDVSCYPIVNIGPIDVSCQPIVYVDVSCTPIVASGLTNTNFDSFGRLRASNPYTLFEVNSILGKDDYNTQEATIGSGTSNWVSGLSYINMAVGTSVGSVVRQSREYIMYQPGKSKLVYMTGVLYDVSSAAATANLLTRMGAFDASMGIYIQMENGTISVVEHDGAHDFIPRSSWDDPLDGTGPSGAYVDFSKAQIFYFDFEWLGVGTVRCGIIQNGRYLTYYTFNHTNNLKYPYIPFAKLPVRYDIQRTAAADVSNSMHMLCATVISEGGFSPIGKNFLYGNNLSVGVKGVDNSATVRVPILGLRLRSDYPFNRGTLKMQKIDIFSASTNAAGSWQILRNPGINTAKFGTPLQDWDKFSTVSGSQIATDSIAEVKLFGSYLNSNVPVANDLSGGTVIYSGFFSQRNTATIGQTVDQLIAAYPISQNIAGTTSDEFILVANCITNAGSAPTLFAIIEWMEFM